MILNVHLTQEYVIQCQRKFIKGYHLRHMSINQVKSHLVVKNARMLVRWASKRRTLCPVTAFHFVWFCSTACINTNKILLLRTPVTECLKGVELHFQLNNVYFTRILSVEINPYLTRCFGKQ